MRRGGSERRGGGYRNRKTKEKTKKTTRERRNTGEEGTVPRRWGDVSDKDWVGVGGGLVEKGGCNSSFPAADTFALSIPFLFPSSRSPYQCGPFHVSRHLSLWLFACLNASVASVRSVASRCGCYCDTSAVVLDARLFFGHCQYRCFFLL